MGVFGILVIAFVMFLCGLVLGVGVAWIITDWVLKNSTQGVMTPPNKHKQQEFVDDNEDLAIARRSIS